MPRLGDRYSKALVTGAGSGLGRAFTNVLLDEGLEVWGTSRHPQTLDTSDSFHAVELDLSVSISVEDWFEEWDERAGGFDVLVNNAGYAVFGEISDIPLESLRDQLQVLLTRPMELASVAFRCMRARGRGSMVNVSSLAGDLWIPLMPAYNASKAGLSAFSQSLMLESPSNPPWLVDLKLGDFKTPFNDNMRKSGDSKMSRKVLKRLDALMAQAPDPEWAAQDLLIALKRFKHCTPCSGSFVQTGLAPVVFRLLPATLKRRILRRYFNLL